MNHIHVRGTGAEVRWGYHRAATLGSWTMQSGPTGATVTAQVASVDAFKVSQRPLTFTVPRPKGLTWSWPILTLQISGSECTASLGPQE
jgi:hypothetical protein